VPTTPHLMAIHPNLLVMDNGVVACVYGRPGFHAVFSTDNGRTWKNRVTFSSLPEPNITGQVHANKTGPNKLMVIGGTGRGGTQVFPITVERVKVSPSRVALAGRVLDEAGTPIADAIVERSPNRYAADDWVDSTELDPWKGGFMHEGSPRLAYRSIQKAQRHPTVKTDANGLFRFDSVELLEYVLTVEAEGFAPQHQHVDVRSGMQSQEFNLKPGRLLRGRVVDANGRPVVGGCIVLNRWHCHTDRSGQFHWSVEAPVPDKVKVKSYKRYVGKYVPYEATISLSKLESQAIVLKLQ